jgi:hypothetical protein
VPLDGVEEILGVEVLLFGIGNEHHEGVAIADAIQQTVDLAVGLSAFSWQLPRRGRELRLRKV